MKKQTLPARVTTGLIINYLYLMLGILVIASFLISPSTYAQQASPQTDPPKPLTYESLRAWHQSGGLDSYHWPKQHAVDLNDDKSDEVFLGLRGYGRGMIYALFTKTTGKWVLLCDEIDGSHHEPRALPAKNRGWHDMEVLSPTGRGGLHERIYTWNGTKYVLKSTREIAKGE